MNRSELKKIAKKELLATLVENKLPVLKKLADKALKEGSVPIDYESKEVRRVKENKYPRHSDYDQDFDERKKIKHHINDEDLEEGLFDYERKDDYDEYGAPVDNEDADKDITGSRVRPKKQQNSNLLDEVPVHQNSFHEPSPTDYEESKKIKRQKIDRALEEYKKRKLAKKQDDELEESRRRKKYDPKEFNAVSESKKRKPNDEEELEEIRKRYLDKKREIEESRRRKHYDEDLEENLFDYEDKDDYDEYGAPIENEDADKDITGSRVRAHKDTYLSPYVSNNDLPDREDYEESRKHKKHSDEEELEEIRKRYLDKKHEIEESRRRKHHDDEDIEENSLYDALEKHPPVYGPNVYESRKRKIHQDDEDLEEAQLPKNVKHGQLHNSLGVSSSKEISNLQVKDIVAKAKSAINSGKVSYATMIRRLNYQAVLNKGTEAGNKFRSAVNQLRDWHESK